MSGVSLPQAGAVGIRHLSFHGSGGSLFGIHIVNVFLTLVTVGVYYFWGKVKVRRYLLRETQGMVKFFESVLKDRDLPELLKYLSSHPTTADRIEKLKALAGASAPTSARLLPDYDWRDIKKICPPPPR